MLRARSVPASRSGARVTCAGEWGGARPAEVPVPASCAAPAAASAPVPGALGLGLLLFRFLVKLSQRGRGGADSNPGPAGPAHARCAQLAQPRRAPRNRGPAAPTLPRAAPRGGSERRPSRLLYVRSAESRLAAGSRAPEVQPDPWRPGRRRDAAARSPPRGSSAPRRLPPASLSGPGHHSQSGPRQW